MIRLLFHILFHTSDNVKVYEAGNRFLGGDGRLIRLDQVQCNGNETTLLDCPAASFHGNSCSHDNDVYVACYPRAVNASMRGLGEMELKHG